MWHRNCTRMLAGVYSGREVVAVLWSPSGAQSGTSCWSPDDRTGCLKRSPWPLCSAIFVLLTGKKLPSLQTAHLAAVCQTAANPCPYCWELPWCPEIGHWLGECGHSYLGHPGLSWGTEGVLVCWHLLLHPSVLPALVELSMSLRSRGPTAGYR